MVVSELVKKLGAEVLTGEIVKDAEVTGIYCGDLLSWVMSHASRGSAWITVHTHLNIVAVASLTELSCIIIPENIEVDEPTIRKAIDENVIIIRSGLSTYNICCIAYECGI